MLLFLFFPFWHASRHCTEYRHIPFQSARLNHKGGFFFFLIDKTKDAQSIMGSGSKLYELPKAIEINPKTLFYSVKFYLTRAKFYFLLFYCYTNFCYKCT